MHFARSRTNLKDPKYNYLFEQAAKSLCDRLLDIKRPFPLCANLGPRNDMLEHQFDKVSKITQTTDFIDIKLDENNITTSKYDLVLANLSLHWENDLRKVFKSAQTLLKEDCPFIGVTYLMDTLFELNTSLMLSQQERKGGISPHVSPFIDAPGLSITVDTLQINVQYDNIFELCEHLNFMGESNGVLGREPLSKDTLLTAASLFDQLFDNTCSFELGFFIGWKKSKAQPVPKERGDFQHSFKDIIQSTTDQK
eukprot:snap_masked-scaffold_31-processed-gene-3.0-mRNA-1 protein AED:0.20 eAED:0.20 QI:0/0/0/1/1/1/2/0/252